MSMHKQSGAVTLLMALLMLLVTTAMTFMTGSAHKEAVRLFGDDLRDQQAYQAASAGISQGLAYLKANQNNDNLFSDALLKEGLGWAKDEGWQDDGSDSRFISLGANQGSYQVVFCEPNASPSSADDCRDDVDKTKTFDKDNGWVLIVAEGRSDDGEAVRFISALASSKSSINPNISSPISGGSTVSVGGSADVVNRYGRTSIWSAYETTLSSNRETKILSPEINAAEVESLFSDPDDIPLVVGTNADRIGVDVVDNDQTLRNASIDDFWLHFIGKTEEEYDGQVTDAGRSLDKSVPVPEGGLYYIKVASGDTQQINNSLSKDGNWGCEDANGDGREDGVVMVIDGDVSINGNVTICGLLFITGNLDDTSAPGGKGNAQINGGLIVKGTIGVSGNLGVEHEKTFVDEGFGESQVAIIAGGWKDWM